MTQSTRDWDLLRAYVERGCEQSYALLVERYVDIVYSAAMRQVRNAHLAEEITQVVFIILARKAASLKAGTVLPAWLHKTTRFTALNVLKTEARRHAHERKAAQMTSETQRSDMSWMRLSPLLDEGVSRLNDKDRAAIMLRYFQDKSVSETAQSLGISEAAAGMRISRAVEKLRGYFRNRGMSIPATSLVAVIASNSVHAAPHGLGGTVAANTLRAIGNPAISGAMLATVDAVIRAMAIAKAKAAAFFAGSIVAAALVAGVFANYVVAPLWQRATRGTVPHESRLLDFSGAGIVGVVRSATRPVHDPARMFANLIERRVG